jgi:phosphatidylserine/phosphatidylglycerophosphate/cardiolipin synthase-like enzyme
MFRKACVVLGTAVLFISLCAGAAVAYTPAPGPIFNNPTGNIAARSKILHHIVGSINSAPRFSTIQMAAYSFDRKDVGNALANANRRGVNVQIVLNDNWTSHQTKRLVKALGTDPNRRSFVVICHGSCRGGYGNEHAKFYLFTKTGKTKNVTMVGSANLTGYGAVTQWNDMYTVVNNAPMFNLYSMVFEQLARDHRVAHPYISKTINGIQSIFYPLPGTTKANDPVMRRLDQVHCKAGPGTGVGGHTVIRIVMYGWVKSRGLYLADKVAALDRRGCDVRVIVSSGGGHVVKHLQRGGVLVRSADLEPRPTPNVDNGEAYDLFTHEKWMILNGGYGKGSSRNVWTGSENWSNLATHNDEVTIHIQRRSAYQNYLANFNLIWNHHSRVPGPIPGY